MAFVWRHEMGILSIICLFELQEGQKQPVYASKAN